MTNDDFRAMICERYPGTSLFVSQRPHACTILCLGDGMCRLLYCGETTPDQIADVFYQAIAAGHSQIGKAMLVDFTYFTGTLDWNYARNRKEIAPGMPRQPQKVAYVMPGETGIKTARALTLWLPQIECDIFSDAAEAERWLVQDSADKPPP